MYKRQGIDTLVNRKLFLTLVISVAAKIMLDLYFKTKSGMLLRAVGDNGTLVTSLAKNSGTVKILGLVTVSYTHLDVYKRQVLH